MFFRALVLTTLAGCATADCGRETSPSAPLLAVEQDGRRLPVSGESVRLRKAPFTLVFRPSGSDGIHVNAWSTPLTFDRLATADDLDALPGFTFTGIAERPFNPGEQLWLHEDSSHHWYWRGEGDHRFSAVRDGEGRRRISRINEAPVEALEEPALYVCVVEADGRRATRKQRVILRFDP